LLRFPIDRAAPVSLSRSAGLDKHREERILIEDQIALERIDELREGAPPKTPRES
jgi:hypothetical protein